MKKMFLSIFVILLLAACSGKNKEDDHVIRVISHMEPMTDLVKIAAKEIQEDGYEIKLVEVSDNRQPNVALNDKEVDANFFQHVPYMEAFNEAQNGNLIGVQAIYDAIVAFYSKTYDSIDEIEQGATVAIPNDPSNMGRALKILHDAKLIELQDPNNREATLEDIKKNSYDFEFVTVDLLTLNQAYEDVDLVYNYPTYIKQIGLSPKTDAIVTENLDNYYSITVVAREDNQDSDKIKALVKAMTSNAVKEYIETELSDTTVPAF